MSDQIPLNQYPNKVFNPNLNSSRRSFFKCSWVSIKSLAKAYPSDLTFQIVISFLIGLVLAPWSWGFLYLIVFFVVFELLYAGIYRDFSINTTIVRLSVVSAAFLGWLIGRLVVLDNKPIRAKYKDKFCKMGCEGYQTPPNSNHHEEDQYDQYLDEDDQYDQYLDEDDQYENNRTEIGFVDRSKMEEYLREFNLS